MNQHEREQDSDKYVKLLEASHDDTRLKKGVASTCVWVAKFSNEEAARPARHQQLSPVSILCRLLRDAVDRNISFPPLTLNCVQKKVRKALSEKGSPQEYRHQWQELSFLLYQCVDETNQLNLSGKRLQDEDGRTDIKRQRSLEGPDVSVEPVKFMLGTVTNCWKGMNQIRHGYINRDGNAEEIYSFRECDLPDQDWDGSIDVGCRVRFRFGRNNVYLNEVEDNGVLYAEDVTVLSGDEETGMILEEGSRQELMSSLRCHDDISFSPKELSAMIGAGDDRSAFILDLVVVWGIYRESIRIARKKEGDAHQVFQKKLAGMDAEHASRARYIFDKGFTTQKGDSITMSEVFDRTHFTNVFHQDDHCNWTLSHLAVEPEITVVVASLCYWTGDRGFVEMLVKQFEKQRVNHNDVTSDPEAFFLATLRRHMRKLNWEASDECKQPALFHRRYRPKLLWDNFYRGIMANSLSKGMTSDSTRIELTTFAMQHLRDNALPLAKAAAKVATVSSYEALFTTIREHLRDTKERDFHAKNLANVLEFAILGDKAGKESDKNGLGPGFRALAHMRNGHGKTGNKMSLQDLEAELDTATRHVQERWPAAWAKRRLPKRRHVQSMYCETSKFFFVVKHGHPAHTCMRGLVPITKKRLEQLANQKAIRKCEKQRRK